MARMLFYPLGNADCTAIEFEDGRLMLVDFAHYEEAESEEDKRVDLKAELRQLLDETKKSSFAVVAFTHADQDHVNGAEEFFYLEHAEKYKEDGRPKITQLWVPACMVTESGLEGSARVIREEAKDRLRKYSGIRVFGQPDSLDKWAERKGLDLKKIHRLIVTAGSMAPGFTHEKGGVEIFAHSPFSFTMEDEEEPRNDNSIVLHLTFLVDGTPTRVFLGADAEHATWENIVYITEKHGKDERLDWDVFRVSHHCSWSALGPSEEKRTGKSIAAVETLFDRAADRPILIASCAPVPDRSTSDPPHRQAAKYYRDVAALHDGEFVVTMGHPSSSAPEPLVIGIDALRATLQKRAAIGGAAVVKRKAPRVG